MTQQPYQPNSMSSDAPADDEISLADIARTLLDGWRLIVALTFLSAAAAAGISLQMTPTFKADTVVQIKSASSKGGGAGLGGLASLAGAAGMAGFSIKGDETLEGTLGVLRSREIVRTFLAKHELVEVVLGAGQPGFSLRQWLGIGAQVEHADPERRMEQAREAFQKSILQISEDKKTGLTSVTMQWRDGDLAARWANDFVLLANQHLRELSIERATRNMQHLNSELEKTAVVAVRQALFQLIEEQVKAIMLASVESEFAIRVVDPAVKPLQRDSPKRTQIVLLAALAAAMLSALIVLVRPAFSAFVAQLKQPVTPGR